MSGKKTPWWALPATASFTVFFAAFAAVQQGAHHGWALRAGVQATATIVRFEAPTGRHSGLRDAEAELAYSRAPNLETRAFVPVSAEFQERRKPGDAVSVHFLPNPYLRPVIDEEPPSWPWLWPALILLCGGFVVLLMLLSRNAPAASAADESSPG